MTDVRPYRFLLALGIITLTLFGCHRAAETEDTVASGVLDRVCVADTAQLYTDPGLTNPHPTIKLGYWDFATSIPNDVTCIGEKVLVNGEEAWVSPAEVRPVYRVITEAELTVPMADGAEEGDDIGHTGLICYLAPGELVALSIQPESAVDGYLFVQTENCDTGIVLEEAITPVGDPGNR